MKILFSRFPLESALHGGAEKQTITLMNGLLQRGHAVSFLGSCPALLALCKEHHIPHASLNIGPPPVSTYHALSFIWRKFQMRRKLNDALDAFHNLDALFMLSLSEKILLTPHAIERNIRVFWQEHDSVGAWLSKNPWLPQLQTLSHHVDTICVSDLSARLFRSLGYASSHSIPNGVPLPPSQESFHHASSSPLHILCIARLSEEKGIDLLLDAVANTPQTRLTLIGTGKEEGALLQRIHQQDLDDRISHISHTEGLEEYFSSADVCVLPSRTNDPFGLVIAEAMLRGIACICTDQCGISGYLSSGTDAIVVPANSSIALEEAIKSLYNEDYRETIANAGKQTALSLFTEDAMIDAYEHLLL